MTKRMREVLEIATKACGAALPVTRRNQTEKTVRALSKLGLVKYVYTGVHIYVWPASIECPFVSAPNGRGGYVRAEEVHVPLKAVAGLYFDGNMIVGRVGSNGTLVLKAAS